MPLTLSAVVAHKLTATTPDDPTYEIRPSHWNSNHEVSVSNTLSIEGSEISGLFKNTNGISFGLSGNGQLTASHDGLTTQSAQAFSASGGASTFQTLNFRNANGLTFSNNGGFVEASYTVPNVPAQSVQTQNMVVVQGNGANGNGTFSSGTVTFAAGNNVTLSTGANVISIHAAAQTVQTQNMVAIVGSGANGNGTFSSGTLTVAAGNNVTLSTGANVVSIHGVAAQTVQTQNFVAVVGAGANGNGTFSSGSVTIAAGNNITLSTGANVISIHGGAGAGGGFSGGVSNLGSTAGTTGTVGSQIVFVGSNGLMLSQSVNGASATITFDDGQRTISSYQNMPNLNNSSILTFGMTSLSHAAAFVLPQVGSFSFMRLPLSMQTNSTTIATLASATASAQFGMTHSFNAVVYSLGVGANSNSLQSVASGSASMHLSMRISITNSTQYSISQGITANAEGGAANTNRTTQYSISNTNYSFTTNQIATEWSGGRFLDIPFANSLSAGAYWLVIGASSSSSSAGAGGLANMTNCNVRYSGHFGVSQANQGFGVMGSTNRTSGGQLGGGFFSTAGGGTTNSIPLSAISSTASNPVPMFMMLRRA